MEEKMEEKMEVKKEVKKGAKPHPSAITFILRNLGLLAFTLVIGSLLTAFLIKTGLVPLTGLVILLMAFLITFSVKNIIVELVAMYLNRKKICKLK